MITGSSPAWFPNSDIRGSKLICSSPRLFAACHVLLRLLMPRHSPYALFCLNFAFLLLEFRSIILTMKKLDLPSGKSSFPFGFPPAASAACGQIVVPTILPKDLVSKIFFLNPVIICSVLLFGFQ